MANNTADRSKEAKRRWYTKNKDSINAARRRGRATYGDRVCKVCNESFTPNRYNQILCGKPECKRRRQTTRQRLRDRADPEARRTRERAKWVAMTDEQRARRNAANRKRYRNNPDMAERKRTKNREAARERRAEEAHQCSPPTRQ